MLKIFQTPLFLFLIFQIQLQGFDFNFFNSKKIPKGWVSQKSPTSKCIIYTPKTWPKGKSGSMQAVWISEPYKDRVLVLRKFRMRNSPPFDFENCTTHEIMSLMMAPKVAKGFSISRLEHDFRMDGESAVWANYKFFTSYGSYHGFTAITWKDGFLYLFESESEKPLPNLTQNLFLKVAEIACLK